MKDKVVLDSDFCQILLSKNSKEEAKAFFKSVFICLDLHPCLHEYVYKEELFNIDSVQDLVNENFIQVISIEDLASSIGAKKLYVILFKDYYKYMNEQEWIDKDDVFSKRYAGKNMGEIHSLILALYLKIPCFFSNDKGAKTLAKNKINSQSFEIEVKNVEQVFYDIDAIENNEVELKEKRRILKSIKKK